MSIKMIFFIGLIILNIIFVIAYLIWNQKQGKDLGNYMKACVMILCPIIAPAFLFGAYLMHRIFTSYGIDLSDVVFDKDKEEHFLHPDEEVERNMVSLEEALEITDKKSLRALMMNVIRGDYKNSLSSISSALNSEDSETAHYAASVLQDVLNDFRANVQEKYLLSKQEGFRQISHCVGLIEYMEPVLKQNVLTDLEQISMAKKMEEVMEIAWNKNKDRISSSIYEKLCQTLLEVKEYDECRKWSERLKAQYPKTLSSYMTQLKLFFSCGDRENFFRVMDELKASDVVVDNETLELIRTFM